MSGSSRVSIPDSFWQTIQDIKETTGQHSDEDIYAALKECNMDPNETAQKLLYLDTFQEVKRKRDRKKVSVNSRASGEHRQIPVTQRRGTGGDNRYSSYDSDGEWQLDARKEEGYRRSMGRVSSKSSRPVLHKESSKVPDVARAPSLGSTSVCNSHESKTSQSAEHNNRRITKDTKADQDIKSRKLSSLRPVTVKQLSDLDPGPTPTSTPTNPSTVVPRARLPSGSLKWKSSHLGNSVGSLSVSGLYSSASDPVLMPLLNPRNPGAAGIIKRETRSLSKAADISAAIMADSRLNAGQNVNFGQEVSGSVDLACNTQLQPVESQDAGGPTLEDHSSKQATSELDVKLQKLHISARQSVIFPSHLHVPEAFKIDLRFGSLNPSLEQNNEDSNPSVPTNIEASKKSSPTPQSSSPIPGHSDYPDQPESPPHVPVNLTSSQENISSGADLRYDQSKQEMLKPVESSQDSLLTPAPDYDPSPVQLQGLEPQEGSSLLTTGTAPSSTQPRVAQSSVAVSPQLFPFFRQPYPPHYVPYSPYYSQLYMPPQNVHQFLNHHGFPHQPSARNIYTPPTAAASGAKFPISPVYKPGTMTHFGISSGYASSTPVYGYGSDVALPTSGHHDVSGSELKENNMHSNIKQEEDLHVLTSTSGLDTSALQANVYYNLPQGQGVAFPPAQVGHTSAGGINNHPAQSVSSQSIHQSQPAGESIVRPYPQKPQLLSLPQQQYVQMNWRQKNIELKSLKWAKF